MILLHQLGLSISLGAGNFAPLFLILLPCPHQPLLFQSYSLPTGISVLIFLVKVFIFLICSLLMPGSKTVITCRISLSVPLYLCSTTRLVIFNPFSFFVLLNIFPIHFEFLIVLTFFLFCFLC